MLSSAHVTTRTASGAASAAQLARLQELELRMAQVAEREATAKHAGAVAKAELARGREEIRRNSLELAKIGARLQFKDEVCAAPTRPLARASGPCTHVPMYPCTHVPMSQ